MRVLLLIFINLSVALATPNQPLYFEASKNGVQILPQRFEYEFLNPHLLKIGDALIDFDFLKMMLIIQGGHLRLQFLWPASFLDQGQILIKDPSGVAIYSETIKKNSVKKYRKKYSSLAINSLRSEIVNYVTSPVPKDLIQKMKDLPFVVFCVYRADEETKINICSQENHLDSKENHYFFKPLASQEDKKPQILINGLPVGGQGMVYLNNSDEIVHFKYETPRKAFLELDIQKNNVNFKDVMATKDFQKIYLVASGAQPVEKKNYKYINSTDWLYSLNVEYPSIYLYGRGTIPLRQDLALNSEQLPQTGDRLYIKPQSLKIYNSSIKITGRTLNDQQLETTDEQSKIQKNENEFTWSINKIPLGSSLHYLKSTQKEKITYPTIEFQREPPLYLTANALYLMQTKTINASIKAHYFLTEHWAFHFNYQLPLVKNDSDLTLSGWMIEIPYKFSEGFFYKNSGAGLAALYTSFSDSSNKMTTASVSTPGVQLFWLDSKYKMELNYFSGTSTLNSFIQARGQYFWRLNDRSQLESHLTYQNINDQSDYGVTVGYGRFISY